MQKLRQILPTHTVIIILAGLFFLMLHANTGITGGDDGYRHARYAHELLADWKGTIGQWHLQYLWPQPVDVWFLYHLLLAPFTLIISPIEGLKIFTALIFALILKTFLKLLKLFNIKYPAFWTIILLAGTSAWIFRMSLGRPVIATVLLMLVAVYACAKDKKTLLFLVCTAYALTHSAFFFVLVVPILYALTHGVIKHGRQVIWAVAGVTLGLLINPTFPQNLAFSLVQSFAPITTGLAQNLEIGGELRPMSVLDLINILPFLLIWATALGLHLMRVFQQPKEESVKLKNFLFGLSFIMFVLMSKSVRFLEYFIPFAVLAAGLAYTPFVKNLNWAQIKQRLRANSRAYWPGMLGVAVLVFLPLTSLLFGVLGVVYSPPAKQFYAAAEYLNEHAPKGTIIFNTQWDQYPKLYYWDYKDFYITGMDPTFFYLADPQKYRLWRHFADDQLLACPEIACDANLKQARTLYSVARDTFGASYVFLENEKYPVLKNYLDHNPKFKKVIGDGQTSLYQIL